MVPYAKRMEKMAFTANVVKGLFGSMTNPDIISFSGGSPAREALPVDTIRQLADEVLRTDTRGVEALQYGPIEGIRDLREVVVRELLAPKGIDCGVDNVIIITGGLEGINLACQAYIDPGDVILVEAPTFVQSVEIFDMFEARCVGVAMDDDGLIPEDLERKIRQCHPKMIYVIPTFQNPTSWVSGVEVRRRIAELAAEFDMLVVEDDPYAALRFSGEKLPTIKSFDTSDNVIVLTSFSKTISPGLRVALCFGNKDLIRKMTIAKQGSDTHSPNLNQAIVAEYINRGFMPKHIEYISGVYSRSARIMTDAMAEHFPEWVHFEQPVGGLFIWCTLPEGWDANEIFKRAVERKVAFVPGAPFFTTPGKGQNTFRLNFSAEPEERIREGIKQIGRASCRERV